MKNGSMSMSVKGVERERYGWVCVVCDLHGVSGMVETGRFNHIRVIAVDSIRLL